MDHHPKPKTAYCDCICELLRAEFCRKLAFPRSLANSPGLTAIKANAEAYNNNIYPDVVKTWGRSMDGTPKVQSGDVVNFTLH
jgi:hypothetical protein